MNLVSVIIPVYNRLEYICETIESVLAQTYKDYEIIVVDDGSTIDIRQTLKPYMNRIKYLYQENKGLAAARNTGIKNSNGKYLTFLDDDDLFEPRKLDIQVQVLEDNSNIGFVYSDYYVFETNNKEKTKISLAPGRDKESSEFSRLFFMNPNVAVPTTLIQRRCFEDVDLFDENLLQHEDGDMFLRISLRWQVKFSDYPSAKVRYHSNRMSLERISMYESIIKSWQKIMELYPGFKDTLGIDGDRKMHALHYHLAQLYLKKGELSKGKEELFLAKENSKSFKDILRIYFYVVVLSFGRIPTKFILRLIC